MVAPMPFRVLTEDKIKTRLLAFRRHGRAAQGAGQRPQSRHDDGASRQAADARAGSVLERTCPFFGAANNARLRAFLDHFGFDYEFASSTDYYTSGRFDATLLRMLAAYDKVMAIILPTLGPDRRATYSPFLPPSAETTRVVAVGANDPPRRCLPHRLWTPAPRRGEKPRGGAI